MARRKVQVEVIVFKLVDNEPLFLMLKRTPERDGFWQPVTGGVKVDEEIKAALERELQEETGVGEYLRLIEDVHYFEFDTDEHGVLQEYVFGVEVAPDTPIALSPEHSEMKWSSLTEALELLKYESNKEALRKLDAMIRKK